VKENDQKLSELSVQMSVLNDIERYVMQKSQNANVVPSLIGINDATLIALVNKLYETEMQLAKVARMTGSKSDQVAILKEDISKIKPDILEVISNIRANYRTSQKNLESSVLDSKNMLNSIPLKEKALIDISRQQVIKNNIFSFLLQKKEETALSYASAVADSRVIEPAEANVKPISPKTNMIYLIGLALGIGLVVMVIMVIEALSTNVLFRKEIERSLSVPILGELMYGDKNKVLVVKDGDKSMLAEQFRMLRTNLSYFGLSAEKNIIQICSSISGEGKSYVATNLAITFSLTGKKVLLLELDLRKPKISRYFKLTSKKGVTDYLINVASLDEIIQTAVNNPNLSIISSGTIPPNPTELVGSEAFTQFIEEIKPKFDYIIVDSAPLSLVTDSQIFAPFAQVTLYVVRHGYTPKNYLNFIQQQVDANRFTRLSIIFNGVKSRGVSRNGSVSGYGSGYGYGYGYGYHDQPNKKSWLKKIFSS
jgi:capsular exopolysaccharide synthesis family protein